MRKSRAVRPMEERFWEKVELIPFHPCWIWKGANKGKVDCYGRLVINGRSNAAHRVAWELFRGQIPSGLLVCHTCDNTLCVRPDHLFLGTDYDNHKDMRAKGRMNNRNGQLACAALKRAMITCKRGHALSGDNVYASASRRGVRACKTCSRELSIVRSRNRRARIKAELQNRLN